MISPKLVRVELKAVWTFIKIMLALTAFRIAGYLIDGTLPELETQLPYNYFLVWWEDAIFTLPLLILKYKNVSNKILIPLMVMSSVAFASAHIYIDPWWAAFLLCYVYYFSYRNGLKYGLGTVMVCHVLYDLTIVYGTNLMLWF
jgi:hypothetical protein